MKESKEPSEHLNPYDLNAIAKLREQHGETFGDPSEHVNPYDSAAIAELRRKASK